MNNRINLPDEKQIVADHIAQATNGGVLLKIVRANLVDQKPKYIMVSFERLMQLLK